MSIQLNEWLSIDKVSGWGNDRVTLTATSNEELEERISNIKFECLTTNAVLNVKQEINPSNLVNKYFWVLLEEEGEISGIKSNTIQYSYDRDSWLSFPSNGSITVPANTYVWFKNTSNILNYGKSTDEFTEFMFSTIGSVGGYLSSMGEMMANNFESLFYFNINLTDASQLILPWEILSEECYTDMFRGCTSLTTAPELPATTLERYCYWGMFQGCTSLTTAPELPATTLPQACYSSMFQGCTSLTTAPELPATTLRLGCCLAMFYNCTSLVNVPSILPATELVENCYLSMFQGCTSLTTAPVLPATRLSNSCYESMFSGCTNLNYIKMLATNISVSDCLLFWVENVAKNGTFVKNASISKNSFKSGASGIPTGWSVIDATE